MAGDHADVPYVQALKYGTGRPDGPPIWIVWHTTEEHEQPDTAERVANYFATLSDGRTVSAHYVHDNNSSVQCVRLADRAWTVGNTPGNNRGINIELAGFASQGSAGWADAYSQAMLVRACEIAARDMAEYRIPNRWCSISDLQARRAGHTTHNDLGIAFGGTTHTDPGPTFPRELIINLISTGGATMTPQEEQDLLKWARAAADRSYATLTAQDSMRTPFGAETNRLKEELAVISGMLSELLARPPVEPAPVDTEAVAAAVVALLGPELLATARQALAEGPWPGMPTEVPSTFNPFRSDSSSGT